MKASIAFFPVRVVPEYRRIIVFRLGKMLGVKGPGVVGVVPFIDRIVTVDLREFYLEIPRQTAITKDNAPISIDFITFFKVVDVILGNRVSVETELAGLDLPEVGALAYPEFVLSPGTYGGFEPAAAAPKPVPAPAPASAPVQFNET